MLTFDQKTEYANKRITEAYDLLLVEFAKAGLTPKKKGFYISVTDDTSAWGVEIRVEGLRESKWATSPYSGKVAVTVHGNYQSGLKTVVYPEGKDGLNIEKIVKRVKLVLIDRLASSETAAKLAAKQKIIADAIANACEKYSIKQSSYGSHHIKSDSYGKIEVTIPVHPEQLDDAIGKLIEAGLVKSDLEAK